MAGRRLCVLLLLLLVLLQLLLVLLLLELLVLRLLLLLLMLLSVRQRCAAARLYQARRTAAACARRRRTSHVRNGSVRGASTGRHIDGGVLEAEPTVVGVVTVCRGGGGRTAQRGRQLLARRDFALQSEFGLETARGVARCIT